MTSPRPGMASGQLTVERAAVALLAKWLPSEIVRAARRYCADPDSDITPNQLEALMTSGEFPFTPRDITVTTTFDDWVIDALPAIQVISPSYTPVGTDQDGIAISYELQVCNLVGAQDRRETRLIRACYEDAIPAVLMQHQSMGGLAGRVTWVGGGAAEFDVDEKDSRTLQGSLAIFEVLVHRVLDPKAGPASPDPLPEVDGVPPVDPDDPTVIDGGATIELLEA